MAVLISEIHFVYSVHFVEEALRLVFLAEFLESGIAAQRVPDRIEPKKGRSNGRWEVIPARIGRL